MARLKRVYMVHPKYWCAARPIVGAQRSLEKDGWQVCSWFRWALTVCVEWVREWLEELRARKEVTP